MTLDLPQLDQRTSHADPWETADSWPRTWPSTAALVLGVTTDGEVIGRPSRSTEPQPIGHIVALSDGRRSR